jgi:hypothetical protein
MKKFTNAQLICKVLVKKGPMTRKDILAALGVKQSPGAKAPPTMACYFTKVSPFSKGYSSSQSLLMSGHIAVAGSDDRGAVVYKVTAKGKELAAS